MVLPLDDELVIQRCLQRIRRWRLPPQWSFEDWRDEVKAQARAEAWQAELDFNPARGVPIARFTYSRVIAGILTRYRQEWRYALHNVPSLDESEEPDTAGTSNPFAASDSEDLLKYALLQLPEADRSFIRELFWGDSTEIQIADRSGMTRQAINKRKRKILRFLRDRLSETATLVGI
jgi:DNA-directed RNA polymerase specialized sigma24 family protein